MKTATLFVLTALLSLTACNHQNGSNQDTAPQAIRHETQAGTEQQARPNILLIVADDLGYSDLGAFGSEIQTPNLDALAASGLTLTNFHVHATCSPTRAMLYSGVDSHIAGLGSMRGLLTPEQQGQPGYETYLNDRIVPFPELLRDSGYHTYIAGKWHMGLRDDLLPDKRGFEESFTLLEGFADHFSLSEFPGMGKVHYQENGTPADLPVNFYSSEFYTDKLIEYIDKHNGDGKPFFAMASYTAPHYPLQAPDKFIARYEGVYDVGYQQIQRQRLQRMRELEIIADDQVPAPNHKSVPDWSELSPSQRELEIRRMQVYAGMVEALDFHIGRLVSHLQGIGELDNTVIFFMSDNGAEGSNPMDFPGFEAWVRDRMDTSPENMGRPESFVWYGPGWAGVSATPFRMYKAFTTEGGLIAPAIVKLPGSALKGTRSDAFSSVLDIAPTFLELAGVQHPGTSYNGRSVAALQGKSMLSVITGDTVRVHDQNEAIGWEIFNRRAIRTGDWKLLSINSPWRKGQGVWSLFDLANDPAEQFDLAGQYPEKVEDLLEHWQRYVEANGVIPLEHIELKYSNSTTHYDWEP